MNWQGLPIKIEVEEGKVRSGKSPDGSRWSVVMPCAYGHIPSTQGDDGEEVDVFVGPNKNSPHVFAINQKDAKTGDHDEQKIMIGFDDETSAAKAYVASFSDGRGKDRLGKMMRLSADQFKHQIEDLRTAKAYASGGRVAYDRGGLVTVQSPSGAKFQVAASYAPKFEALLADLEESGYAVDPKASSGYNYRNIAGTNKLSNHAHGAAIDVNWDRNARGTTGDLDPELARTLSKKHGLAWGGDWKNPDPMHFEVPNAAPLPMSARSMTAYAGHGSVAESDDADISEKPYTRPAPVTKGWGEGVGNEILKRVASEEDPDYPSLRLASLGGFKRLSADFMPYGGSIEGWTKMPYQPEKKADGGPAEVRAYTPTLGDRINQGIDYVGGLMGYDDLPERTQEVLDLIEIPALLAPVAGPSMRTLGIMRGGEAGRDAGIADSLMRYGTAEQTVAPGSKLATGAGRQQLQRNNALLSGDARSHIQSRAPERFYDLGDTGLPMGLPRSPPANVNSGGLNAIRYDQAVMRGRKPDLDVLPGGKRAAGGVVAGALRSPRMGAGGRTDTLPISVASGAFVFPADTVSALGENNTEHGFRVLEEMFAESRAASRGKVTGQEKNEGGGYESSAEHVPIIAAEGEWVVPPEDVAWIGGGDLDRGHKILEKLVLRIRNKHIDDLKKLPRPHR